MTSKIVDKRQINPLKINLTLLIFITKIVVKYLIMIKGLEQLRLKSINSYILIIFIK